ncbi:hypothetical protein HDV01_007413 [Terramyces sp. JEL0728]|nr:hypothetical protein HDV01_007413 [Terramyces sp. JEL0728]
MLHTIPIELDNVALYLNLKDYTHLRLSIKINLPKISYCNTSSFHQSYFDGYDFSQHVMLSKEYITRDILDFFVSKHCFAQFKHSFKLFKSMNLDRLKLVILDSTYESDTILLLLDSYGDQQSNSPPFNENHLFQTLLQNAVIKYVNQNQPKLLLKITRNIDPSFNDNYPLLLSAQLKRIECIEILLDHPNVDPSIQNNYVFKTLVDVGNSGLLKKLLDDPRVDPASSNQEAFFNSVRARRKSIVKLLLDDSRIDPTANSNQSLMFASMLGNTDIVELLLNDSRVDPSIEQCKAFQLACSNGHVDIVNLMLKDVRIDPSGNDSHSFKTAAMNGHAQIVTILLKDKRVDPSADGCFALRKAVRNGNITVTQELLLDTRNDPTIHDNYPIRISCLLGSYEMVELLLRDKRISIHGDCLNNAIESGNLDVVQLLLTRTVPDDQSVKHSVQMGKTNITALLLNDKRLDPQISAYYSKLIKRKGRILDFTNSMLDYVRNFIN